MKTVAELKEELNKVSNDYYCHPNMLQGYTYLPSPNSSLDKPKIGSFSTDPFSARVLILKLEEKYNLSIRVYDNKHYCRICIDKKE